MKKHNLAALTIAAVLFLTACGSTTNISGESSGIVEGIGDTMPLKTVTQNFESELNELKNNPHVNIDWSNAAIGYPLQGISECYAVKMMTDYEVHPDKVMTVEEQLAQFESYCKSTLFDNINLVSNNTPTETIFSRDNYSPAPVYGGVVRVVCCKFLRDSVICTERSDSLSEGERLRVMRLCAGFTIDKAAKAIGVDRGTIMNYELGRVRRMNQAILQKYINCT